MSPYNRNQTFDPNIIKALKNLPKIMMNNENKEITIRVDSRNKTGEEHIAVATHGLQVRDIKLIPSLLKNPFCCCKDPNNKNHKNYYCQRKGMHNSNKRNKGLYLKVVTCVKLDGNEEIVTAYPTNRIKELKK